VGREPGRRTPRLSRLLHAQGRTWAEIGQLVGQKKLSITADVYTHVLIDAAEIDYAAICSDGADLRADLDTRNVAIRRAV